MTFLNIHKIENERTRSIVNVVLFVAVCFFAQAVSTLLIAGFGHFILQTDFTNFYAFTFVAYLFQLPIILFVTKKWNIDLRSDIKPINLRIVLILISVSITIFLLNPIISEPIRYFTQLVNGQIVVFLPRRIDPGILPVLSLISYVVFAPVFEEIVFRKMIFNYLRRSFSIPFAIAISSILFALVHMQFSGTGFMKLIYGVAFCIAYYKTKTIITPIVFHAIVNIIAQLTREHVIDATAINISRYFPFLLLGILFLFFLIKGLYKQTKCGDKSDEAIEGFENKMNN